MKRYVWVLCATIGILLIILSIALRQECSLGFTIYKCVVGFLCLVMAALCFSEDKP